MTCLRGANERTVRRALDERDPLPGTAGFAGEIDGLLVRDVLGRVPLYVEEVSVEWAFRPADLDEPSLVPAGVVVDLDDETTDRVWELPNPEPDTDRPTALERVDEAIHRGVNEAGNSDGGGVHPGVDGTSDRNRTVAVGFSGGVDSALVAELLDAPLYVVGFPGSHDVEAARTAAAAMGRDLTVVELEHADLERAIPTVARAIGRTNAMDVGIALSLYLVGERAAADGFDALAVGQGADELFGGYEKVVHLDHRVEAETVRGAVREQILTLPAQLPRDVLALEAAGVEPVAPLLHDAVVEAALRLPTDLLADETERKRGFRQVARTYLPREVADREKKAVQYGSLVARELDRLARQAGYKRKIGDHVTKYVEAKLAADAT